MLTAFEIDQQLALLRSRYIATERDDQFLAHFNRLLRVSPEGVITAEPTRFTSRKETRGIVVVDGPGGGKTTLVNRALERHPAMVAAPGAAGRPYLFVEVKSPATLTSLGLTIIGLTKYPHVSEARLRADIFDLVRTRLDLLGITVLWIDEAHDLFRARARQETENILRTLKSLMQGDQAVIVILSGTERLLEITERDEQVSRRFTKLILPRVDAAVDAERMWKVLLSLCERAGLAPPERESLPGRIIHAGRGRFGRCIETMINGIEMALRSGSVRLERQHFAEAFGLYEGCLPEENVFLAPTWSHLILDPVAQAPSPSPARRGRRTR